MPFLVYSATCTAPGPDWGRPYFGCTGLALNLRRNCHHSDARRGVLNPFYDAIRQWGEGAWRWDPLEEIDDRAAALDMERELIAQARAAGLNPFNDSAGGEGRRPVTIRGVRYGSETEAANALGVSVSAITGARHRGTLDYVGLGHRSIPKPIVWRGIPFGSQKELAGHLGMSTSAVNQAVKEDRVDSLEPR